MNIKNLVSSALALVLCGCMASPAFAYVDENLIEQEIPVIDEQEETTEQMGPLTPDGNLTIVDDYNDGKGKQFITMVSKNGNYFYLIIDRDDKGEQTVHFLNMVDESDLLALMDEDEAAKYTEQEETPTPTATPEPEPTVEPEAEEKSMNPVPFVILLLAVLGGGGFFAYKKYSEKKKAEQAAKPDPDADYTDEEYILPDEPADADDDTEIDLTDDEPV